MPYHQRLGAAELSALLTASSFQVKVLGARPQGSHHSHRHRAVGLAPSAKKARPGPGNIIETNSTFLAALVRECKAASVILARQPDQYEAI